MAGLYTAYHAAAYGKVALLTKSGITESNSYFAQGGIAAVTDEDDAPALHFEDTIIAGRGLCDYPAVDILVNEDMIVDLPQEIFKDVEAEEMVVGHVLPMMDSVGRRLQGKILSIGDEEVRIDFNHPLAGKDLFFKGEILGVRDATDEELEALHSHKCGGCSGCGSEGGCGSHDEGCGCGGCH